MTPLLSKLLVAHVDRIKFFEDLLENAASTCIKLAPVAALSAVGKRTTLILIRHFPFTSSALYFDGGSQMVARGEGNIKGVIAFE